jgi:arginine repressor
MLEIMGTEIETAVSQNVMLLKKNSGSAKLFTFTEQEFYRKKIMGILKRDEKVLRLCPKKRYAEVLERS